MIREDSITRPRPDQPNRREERSVRRPRRRTVPCPGADTDNNNGAPEPAATGGGDLRTQVLLFAHLAQVALTLSSLSARRRDEVQSDLAMLRSECDRGRVRPAVVVAVVDSVLEVMTPDLPEGVARSLAEARPEPGDGPDELAGPLPDLGPCLT